MGRPPLKKGAIERSALELFVEKGVDGTSIRDIAQRAGVTEGALYRHHRSKDDLVRHLFLTSFEKFAGLFSEVQEKGITLKNAIPRLVEGFFALYDEDPYIFQLVMLTRHKLLDEVRADERNAVELLSRLVNQAVKTGEIPKQNAALTTQVILGMVMQVASGASYGRLKSPIKPLAETVAKYCQQVVSNPPA